MRVQRNRQRYKGGSLVGAIVGLTVVAFSLVICAEVLVMSQKLHRRNLYRLIASQVVQNAMARMKAEGLDNLAEFGKPVPISDPQLAQIPNARAWLKVTPEPSWGVQRLEVTVQWESRAGTLGRVCMERLER